MSAPDVAVPGAGQVGELAVLLQDQREALSLMATGAPLAPVLEKIAVAAQARAGGGMRASIQLANHGHLVHGAAPALSESFRAQMEGLPIAAGIGTCGQAARTGQPVISADIETDACWADRRDAAQACGLRACWSVPVIGADGQLIGTFGSYYPVPGGPTAADLIRIGVTAQTVALCVERYRSDGAMRRLQDSLEAQVTQRTRDLTELARHLQNVREDERSRLARELHDELGGLFTAAKLDATRIRMRLAEASPEVAERLSHLIDLLNRGVQIKRRIIEDLTPSALGHLGLLPALEILVDDCSRQLDLPIEHQLKPVALSPRGQLTVYRLVQEALTNISKYAQARHVHVGLLETADGQVRVSVTDDGLGFDPEVRRPAAHGLLGMRYRIESEGGVLSIRSAPGRGTRISAHLPRTEPVATGPDRGPAADSA